MSAFLSESLLQDHPDVITEAELYQTAIPPAFPTATRVNGRDAYPVVIRPLDLTVVAIPNDHGIRRGLRDLGIKQNDSAALVVNRIHLGRFYVNLSWVMWQADILPFTDARDWEAQLFGNTGTFVTKRPALTRAQKIKRSVAFPRLIFHMIRAVAGRTSRLRANLAARTAFVPATLSDAALLALVPRYREDLTTACGWLTRGSFVPVFLVAFLSRLSGPDRMPQVVAALSDLGEVESAKPALRLRALATRMRAERPDIVAAFIRTDDRLGLLRREAPDFAGEVDRLLARFGYRSVAEFMITQPSWADDPRPLLDSLVGLLGAEAEQQHRVIDRKAVIAALVEGMGPVRAAVVRLMVQGAHLGARTREESKGNLIVRVDMLRRLFRELGVRLAGKGVIDHPQDIDYLMLDEVMVRLGDHALADVRPRIVARRAEAQRLEALPEPPELIEFAQEIKLSSDQELSTGAVLNGQGVSGSAIEGIARVIDTTDALDLFEPGDILVAAFTDAGWTPYFTLASGVVVETGGLLTHTSVVARELGLPSVVGVRDATRLLRTGDRIRLEPAGGTVTLLERAA